MTDNETIYETPASDLIRKDELPDEFMHGDLTAKTLRQAGWLSILYLILLVPSLWISFMAGFDIGNSNYEVWSKIFLVTDLLLWIVIILIFKKFLNARFGFFAADRYISILIILSVVLSIASWFMGADSEVFSVSSIIYFIMMLPYGIITILFGKKLLSINTSFKYLSLYAWITIISGVFMASVVLFILALPFGFVSSLVMALIFFNAAREIDNPA